MYLPLNPDLINKAYIVVHDSLFHKKRNYWKLWTQYLDQTNSSKNLGSGKDLIHENPMGLIKKYYFVVKISYKGNIIQIV